MMKKRAEITVQIDVHFDAEDGRDLQEQAIEALCDQHNIQSWDLDAEVHRVEDAA